MKKKTLLLILILAIWIASGCRTTLQSNALAIKEKNILIKTSESPTPAARDYSTNLDELRAKFNRDKGKVRLVTLLSPT